MSDIKSRAIYNTLGEYYRDMGKYLKSPHLTIIKRFYKLHLNINMGPQYTWFRIIMCNISLPPLIPDPFHVSSSNILLIGMLVLFLILSVDLIYLLEAAVFFPSRISVWKPSLFIIFFCQTYSLELTNGEVSC